MADKFLVYVEEFEMLDNFSNEEVGILFRAIMEFVKTGDEQDVPPALVVAYRFIISHIKRDREKYLEVCEKRRLAGKKSGEVRKEAKEQNLKQDVKDRLDFAFLKSISN